MAKLNIIVVLFSVVILSTHTAYSKAIPKEKVTKLRFFIQDRISGPNQTVYKVAESNITSTSRSLFGQVNVIDDPFTVGPKPTSKILGRAQGIIGFADLNEIGLHMSITFSFTSGKYNGTTLSMLGRNGFSQESRMMPIIGGTGAFELARGIVTSTTYSFDPTTNHAVLEYNIVVHHY